MWSLSEEVVPRVLTCRTQGPGYPKTTKDKLYEGSDDISDELKNGLPPSELLRPRNRPNRILGSRVPAARLVGRHTKSR